MSHLLGLLLQAFFDYQTRLQAERLREAGLRAAEKGRRMALALVFFSLSGAFFFSSLLMALIDLGLQIDRAEGLHFSGLMISATILLLLGSFSVLAGWLTGREPERLERSQPSAASPPPPRNELREAIEDLAATILRDLAEAQKAKRTHASNPHQHSPTSSTDVHP